MWFYNFGLILYVWAIRLVAPRHPKARLWIEGRKDLFRRMREAIAPTDRIIWIHVASLGEFEQGRPIIEQLRKTHPEYKILLTFFSPSGYEIRKNYKGVDYIFYLPIDTPRNARRFLDAAHPEIAIFVKYEYWLNLLRELRRRKIRTYVVSAIFRRNSVCFRPYGGMWRQALESFDVMFVQNEESKKLLATLGFDNVLVAGEHALRPRGGDRPARPDASTSSTASRATTACSWQDRHGNPDEELLIRLINDVSRREIRRRPPRNGRVAYRTADGRNQRRRAALHAMHAPHDLRFAAAADPRHGGDSRLGLRLRHLELYRRRLRRRHSQHARSRRRSDFRWPSVPTTKNSRRPAIW